MAAMEIHFRLDLRTEDLASSSVLEDVMRTNSFLAAMKGGRTADPRTSFR